jgi:hypothetical protein
MEISDTLIFPGGECKALADGRVGGYLVLFGDAKRADLSGDFFTAETDFGLDQHTKSRIYFDHGLNPTLKKLYVGEVELKIDAKGVFADGVIKARDEYSKQVKEIIGKDLPALIAGKKLGWSSGTAAHLVEREPVGDAWKITAWPLGLDASLTATPCEPRTLAVPLKSWIPSAAKGVHLGEMAEAGAAMSAIQHLHNRLHDKTWQAMADEKMAPKARMKRISDAYDECKSMCMKTMTALLGEPGESKSAGDDGAIKAALALQADLLSLEAALAGFHHR